MTTTLKSLCAVMPWCRSYSTCTQPAGLQTPTWQKTGSPLISAIGQRSQTDSFGRLGDRKSELDGGKEGEKKEAVAFSVTFPFSSQHASHVIKRWNTPTEMWQWHRRTVLCGWNASRRVCVCVCVFVPSVGAHCVFERGPDSVCQYKPHNCTVFCRHLQKQGLKCQ